MKLSILGTSGLSGWAGMIFISRVELKAIAIPKQRPQGQDNQSPHLCPSFHKVATELKLTWLWHASVPPNALERGQIFISFPTFWIVNVVHW